MIGDGAVCRPAHLGNSSAESNVSSAGVSSLGSNHRRRGAICPPKGVGAVLALPIANAEAIQLHFDGLGDLESDELAVTDPFARHGRGRAGPVNHGRNVPVTAMPPLATLGDLARFVLLPGQPHESVEAKPLLAGGAIAR